MSAALPTARSTTLPPSVTKPATCSPACRIPNAPPGTSTSLSKAGKRGSATPWPPPARTRCSPAWRAASRRLDAPVAATAEQRAAQAVVLVAAAAVRRHVVAAAVHAHRSHDRSRAVLLLVSVHVGGAQRHRHRPGL